MRLESASPSKSYAEAVGGAATPPPRELDAAFEIAGTWDFKWPLGSTIRVAFQALPRRTKVDDRQFQRAKCLIQSLAECWHEVLPDTVHMQFLSDDLLPPLEKEKGFETFADRSIFSEKVAKERPYDVLVSLRDLPVEKFDLFRGKGQERETIELPVSTLGSYARRADYGMPTMYLGRFGHFLELDLVDYFEQPLVKNIVLHEFGHMLGLPHMHQHPGLVRPEPLSSNVTLRIRELDAARGKFYQDPKQVAKLVSGLLGVEVSAAVAQDHLIQVWRGNESFSDWPDLPPEVLADHQTGQLDSIMTFPYYSSTLRRARPCSACDSAASLSARLKDFPTKPGRLDREMLARMYDPSFTPTP